MPRQRIYKRGQLSAGYGGKQVCHMDVSPDDLQFREYAGYVDKALQKKGLKPAANMREAEIAVFLGYGIGPPKENIYSYNLPQWGQTGVSSAQTSGTVNSYGNYSTFSANTKYTPTYGVTGYTTQVNSYTTHTRYMFVDAIDLNSVRREKKSVRLWSTEATSTGSSGDLREVFPAMVLAAEPSMGVDTGQQVSVEIATSDERIKAMREPTLQPQNVSAD